MAAQLQRIFIDPPFAIARLGGSSTPQEAYVWADGVNPRSGDSTQLLPRWTLKVAPNGSVTPAMPTELHLRDGDLVRPVCPFFEVWALMGEPGSRADTWTAEPLTFSMLGALNVTTADLSLTVDACNAKAARRRNDPSLRIGTFPPLTVTANVITPQEIAGVSPPGTTRPMIPAGRHIPLGQVRWLRSEKQPAAGSTPWASEVNIETMRFRFTPPSGLFYGPPAAERADADLQRLQAVPKERAFLTPEAGWFNAPTLGIDNPSDTYDALAHRTEDDDTGPSLGVVDDTSDARLTVTLRLPQGNSMSASAHVLVAPPDFAPDRRPFLSLADELNDREANPLARSEAMTPQQVDEWIEDLFERVYETVSLQNLDKWRASRAKPLTPEERGTAIAGDGYNDGRSMGAADRLRAGTPVAAASGSSPLPLATRARERHRQLADIVELRRLVLADPNRTRLHQLIRRSFHVGEGESFGRTSMQMPPFMRNSNALPLTLASWQYDLVMAWSGALQDEMSAAAKQRLNSVLSDLDARGQP